MTSGSLNVDFTWPNIFSEFIYTRTYSRWIEKETRREKWEETVLRYFDFFVKRVPENHQVEFTNACQAILNLEIMPSMRALWTAGLALEKENLVGYNCSYLHIDNIKAFGEMLYCLMCGVGVGYSVERQFINLLPVVPEKLVNSSEIIDFKDSKRGWAVRINTSN